MDNVINIKDLCGKNIVSRDDGKKVYADLVEKLKANDQVVVDFGSILIASVSFIDEIFGTLAFTMAATDLRKRIRLENITEFDKVLLNDILRSRYNQKEIERLKPA